MKLRKLLIGLGGLYFIGSSLGCAYFPTHLHNSEYEKVALDIQMELKDYRETQPSVYEGMLSNLETFKEEEEYVISKFAANYHNALVTALPLK